MTNINVSPVFPIKYMKNYCSPPQYAKKKIPEWFKNINTTFKNIKNCPPVTNFLTEGFYIPSPGNFKFLRYVVGKEEHIDISGDLVIDIKEDTASFSTPTMSTQTYDQIPLVKNGIKKSIFKFHYFWKIDSNDKSILYIPAQMQMQCFSIFPAIIDSWSMPPSFPAYCNFDDKHTHEWEIKKDEPIAYGIPIERNDIKINIQDFKGLDND